MIREMTISARAPGEDEIFEPPTRVLGLCVIGRLAHLDIYELDEAGNRGVEPTASLVVPAKSMLLALTAAIEDNRNE
jgi:hypothetical protein